MVTLQSQVDLSSSNTLNLPCIADNYIELNDSDELLEAFRHYPLNDSNYLCLGGGSNLILPPKLNVYVLAFKTKTPSEACIIKREDHSFVWVDVEAGVEWDAFVAYSVAQGYSCLENLSLIPGTVGAAPIQNIGAYGVEVSDCLVQVKVFNVAEKKIQVLDKNQCQFAYRDSIFKRHPGMYIIISVGFRLNKQARFFLDYGELSVLKAKENLTGEMVRQAVIETRLAKLPDPKLLPNAGSFFKNPVVSAPQMEKLRQKFPLIVSYPLATGEFKLAAAWLIDQSGWKGYRNASVGIHDKQALVVVNHHHGSQSDILALANTIQCSVSEKFGVELEVEPVLISA